jgi:acyl carrier protein
MRRLEGDAVERVRVLFAEALQIAVEEVGYEAAFYEDLRGDSLQKLDLAVALEEEFDVRLSDEQVSAISTVSDVVIELRRAPPT